MLFDAVKEHRKTIHFIFILLAYKIFYYLLKCSVTWRQVTAYEHGKVKVQWSSTGTDVPYVKKGIMVADTRIIFNYVFNPAN